MPVFKAYFAKLASSMILFGDNCEYSLFNWITRASANCFIAIIGQMNTARHLYRIKPCDFIKYWFFIHYAINISHGIHIVNRKVQESLACFPSRMPVIALWTY